MYYVTIIISYLETFAKIIKWWSFCQIVGYSNLPCQLVHRRYNSTQGDGTLIPFRTGFFGWYDKWFVSRKINKIYHNRRKAERISSEDKKRCTVWSGNYQKNLQCQRTKCKVWDDKKFWWGRGKENRKWRPSVLPSSLGFGLTAAGFTHGF